MNLLLSRTLRRLSKLYNKRILQELPDIDSEYSTELLLHISLNNHPTAQKHLAEYLHIDKSRVAILIDSLNQANYIYTERNPADRREHFVYLTDKGKQLLPAIHRAIDKVNASIKYQLSEQSLDNFYDTLLQLETNLSS
ncbi:hypothetical protein BEL04_18360 [Mucilaginibacter sp. PPCGB 2223]|uniref:MarR family winged helix-turn-helix transcriptional regulator n=1 Tax=Mucilaginibacter sp. PPCGB 2223 TaxID=1886027 RepID=UPI00082673CD|nr:MarR family winged helix-turn-helix transcriptional regulator [Mucilaginibacter sp. PPCGB 2223]OCX51962.1 hypothetical protein BEL04_18360 [Mucilaginibacter sp. PPCGB 2223]